MEDRLPKPAKKADLIVLILDDDMEEHFILQVAIDSIDMEIEIVNTFNTEQASAYLEDIAQVPDLLIVDNNLRGISGIQFLCELNDIPKFKNIPVMIYAGAITKEIEERAKACNVRFIIEKIAGLTSLSNTLEASFMALLKEKKMDS